MTPPIQSDITNSPSDEARLPLLPVVRETYCSQKQVDDALTFLQQDAPNLIHELVNTSRELPENFPETLEKIIARLTAEDAAGRVTLPENYIGVIDLLFEICRRFEQIYGWSWPVYRPKDGKSPFDSDSAEKVFEVPHFAVRGKPITPELMPPLPEFPALAISQGTSKKGLRQASVDEVLGALYAQHPLLWIELAEEMRHGLRLTRTERRFLPYLADILNTHHIDISMRTQFAFILEIRRRISLLTGLPFYN